MRPITGRADLRPQSFQPVERKSSPLGNSFNRYDHYGKLAASGERTQKRARVAVERDAVAKGRRDASELNRLAVVHAVGDEVVIAPVGDLGPRHGEFRVSATATDR